MGVLRVTITAVLMLAMAASAGAQCISHAETISTRHSAPNLAAGPLAWANGVLAVAKFDEPTDRIFVAVYDEHFVPLTGDRLIASDVDGGPLALVFNGTGFGLFYRTGNDLLVLQRLNLSGEPVGTPIPVSARKFAFDEEMDVVWSDALGAYAIVSTFEVRTQVRVFITVMDRDGIVKRDLDTFVFADLGEVSPAIAVTDDGTIGAFYRAAGEELVVGVRVPRDGGPAANTVSAAGHDIDAVALGNRFYIVRSVEFAPGLREIRWVVIDTAGNIVGADRPLIHVNDLDVQPMAIISNGRELAVSYREGFGTSSRAFRLHRFTPAGALIANSLFAAGSPPQRFATSTFPFAWTGSGYLTTAVRDTDSLLIRLCELRASISVPRHFYTNDEDVVFTANAEGGAPGYSYFWNTGNSSRTYTGPTLSFRYIHNGTYTATLTVVDSAGVTTTTTQVIRIVER